MARERGKGGLWEKKLRLNRKARPVERRGGNGGVRVQEM